MLNRVAGLSVLDRWGVRRPAERAVYHSTKTGFRTAGAVNRTFHKMRASGAAARPSAAPGTRVFDLDPTEDQQMMVQVVRDFAADVLSPAAAKAEAATEPSSEVLGQANELGVTLMSLPEELGGLSAERSATTGVLVGEALDMATWAWRWRAWHRRLSRRQSPSGGARSSSRRTSLPLPPTRFRRRH